MVKQRGMRVAQLIREIVSEGIDHVNKSLVNSEALNALDPSATLYGSGGALDSLSLVALVTELEERVSEVLGVTIVLADEKMVSLRNSPFRSIDALVEYIELCVDKASEKAKEHTHA